GVALLVSPEGRFVGLVTDGDVRRALLHGLGLESPLGAVGRPPPTVGRVGMPPADVGALLSEAVRVIPLLDSEGYVVDLVVRDVRVRIPVAGPTFGENELRYVTECVVTGWVSSAGAFVTRLE